MLHGLYHAVTDTDMTENDLPTWCDMLGGLLYAATLL